MPDSKQILNPIAGIATAIFLVGIIVGALLHGYFNNDKLILNGYYNGYIDGVHAAAAPGPKITLPIPAERYQIVSTTNVNKTVKKSP